jgi:hypothetical protein
MLRDDLAGDLAEVLNGLAEDFPLPRARFCGNPSLL